MTATTLTNQLSHRPFPDVANAIRSRIENILKEWHVLALEAMPHLDELTVKEFENSIGEILAAVADSLETDAVFEVKALVSEAPLHGLDRFLQQYPLNDVLAENRILRSVILLQLEEELGRPLKAIEAASLHAALDVMFHYGVIEMVKAQEAKARQAVESELKFLSFLSHDLSNNLFAVAARLDFIEHQIAELPQLAETVEMLQATRKTIDHTREGMNRLLKHEQLRVAKPQTKLKIVRLRDAVEMLAKTMTMMAKLNNVHLEVTIDANLEVETDAELLTLVLQNIINNAVKHCGGGPVRISGGCSEDAKCRVSVADEGRGIDQQQLGMIFEAFERGSALGAPGVGLGLAIASQAAKLLCAEIEVETELGKGTTFHILLPWKKAIQEQPAEQPKLRVTSK